jgi:signal transduction histidine kinase
LVKSVIPDLILLDIQMPEINGYEVCEKLKANLKTKDIPVIFVSALSDTFDKVKAFEVGGVDYITKPYQAEEVLARVHTHLSLSNAQKQLAQKNQALIKLNQEKNEFLGIVAHDLKNPLSAIKGYSEEIEEYCNEMSEDEIIEYSGLIQKSSAKMFTLITNLLDVNKIESEKIELDLVSTNILPIVESVVQDYAKKSQIKNIKQHFNYSGNNFNAYVDANTLGQVLDNIISNAVKYSPLGKNIYINLIANDNKIRCEVKDEGLGLSTDDQKNYSVNLIV